MVAYADLILPDTTYLERHDCISLMDRPICDADGAADAIRQPVVKPDRDVRPFQDVLIDLGARLGLPGLVKEDGSAKYPGFFPDYMVNHERRPGIGMLAGWRGNGNEHGKGAPNPKQIESYIANGCFWRHELAENQRFYRHANRDYLQWAAEFGLVDRAEQIVLQIYSEPLQRFRLAADGHGHVHPPEQHRERLRKYFDPLPIWYPPFEEAAIETRNFPLHALTQRPMAMYHSWGSQNAWLRQIHGRNHLYINRQTAKQLDLADDDWVWLDQPSRPHQGASQGDGGREPRHGLDLECHRQAAWRLEPGPASGGGPQGIPAQSPDLGIAAAEGGRSSLFQQRSHHRPGGLVRSAGADREGRRT